MFKLYHWLTNFDEMINWIPTTQKRKKKKNPPNTKQRGHAQSVRLGQELEVTVVVSTLYSLITNLVNGGFAVGINGDAILMMFVRVGQVFSFLAEKKGMRTSTTTPARLWWRPPPPPALKPNFNFNPIIYHTNNNMCHVVWLCRFGRKNQECLFFKILWTYWILVVATSLVVELPVDKVPPKKLKMGCPWIRYWVGLELKYKIKTQPNFFTLITLKLTQFNQI